MEVITSKHYLIIDMSNLLYRTFFAHSKNDDLTIAGMAHHSSLVTMNKYFKKYNPHQIIACFDRPNWRKDYTQTDKCVSGLVYKGNRRLKMTPKERATYEAFRVHLADFEEMLRENSSIITLAGPGLEADDLIAGFTEMHTLNEDNDITIVSADKDLIQLLRYPNVILMDPSTGKQRTLEEWEDDPDLFMFEKCIRGDRGDHVQSAFPRVRTKRLRQAYEDPMEYANLMHESWVRPSDKKTFVVKHIFEENQKLMDLTKQPDDIRKLMFTTILREMKDPGKYSHFHFLRFCGRYELKRIKDQAESFASLLSR